MKYSSITPQKKEDLPSWFNELTIERQIKSEHYTLPWLDQIERWFATLTEKYIHRNTHRVGSGTGNQAIPENSQHRFQAIQRDFFCELLTQDINLPFRHH